MRFTNQLSASLLLAVVGALQGGSLAAQQSPVEELAGLQPAADFEVALFASEPLITNPSAIDVDSHGRVWVAEIQWYRSQAKKPPADKIKVLEDTDGDGKADRSTTFAEGLFCPMSVCVAGEKVYVATSPDLWVYEDKNGDLRADGPPRKLLTGFKGINHDHGAHSLFLGPDHKWWMSIGDAGFDITGTDGSHIEYRWGAVLRGELDGSQLEVVAANFRNPYELCLSSFGEAFVSDNDNDGNESTRFCWVLEGGNYGWYGRPPARPLPGTAWEEHWHFRGPIPGHVPALLATGFGAPCGMCFYEGDAWGPKQKNVALLAEAGRREIWRFEPRLAGFGKSSTKEAILTSTDFYFRPDDVCTGPDGYLYVADWYDGGVGGHAYNNPQQGRIFVLRPKGSRATRQKYFTSYERVADAVEGLKSPNLATQYLARKRLLAAGQQALPDLERLLEDDDPNIRARALWLLDRTAGPGRKHVVQQLANGDPAFRALAIRILRRHGADYLGDILALANDSSDDVVREVLLAIRTARGDDASAALARIAGRYDGNDRYLLETINVAAADRKAELYQHLAARREFTANQFDLLLLLNPPVALQRLRSELLDGKVDASTFPPLLAGANAITDPEAGRALLSFVARSSADPSRRRQALETVAIHLDGQWSVLKDDQQLATALRTALADEGLRQAALRVIGLHQLQSVDAEVLLLAAAPAASDADRIAAIKTTVQLAKSATKVETLRQLLSDPAPAVREASFAAVVVDLQDLATARDTLRGQLGAFPLSVRSDIASAALDTPGGAIVIAQLVREGVLPAELVQHIVAKAAGHPDANVRSRFERFIPAEQRQERLGEARSADEILALRGNPQRGDVIFHQNSAAQCMTCHRVRGQGGAIGPGLNAIGAKYDRPQLLDAILYPSKAIAPEFVSYNLTTKDGRVLGGLLVEKKDNVVVMKDAQGRIMKIPAANVESIDPQPISMMPDLVLRDVSAQDAADLLAYLTTLR